MDTRILQVHSPKSGDPAIIEAAELLKRNQVVAFPTETVYGLGANALSAEAVERIYQAKGRPANNPVIVHIADIADARALVLDWPETAERLSAAFWPGPLTLVLPKSELIPDIVSAGGNTVGLRIPAHPLARALIRACGFPLAAPSANQSNYISPTTAAHVMKSLGGRIPLILDGGSCESGIESTVVSLSDGKVTILRAGIYTAEQLSELVGTEVGLTNKLDRPNSDPMLSPGMLKTHYAPNTPLMLVNASEFEEALSLLATQFIRIGSIRFEDSTETIAGHNNVVIRTAMPKTPGAYAQKLYAVLYELDSCGLDAILCELPPDTAEWNGVKDRLKRAGKLLR